MEKGEGLSLSLFWSYEPEYWNKTNTKTEMKIDTPTAMEQYQRALHEHYPANIEWVPKERKTITSIGYTIIIQQVIPEISQGVHGHGHFLMDVRETRA